MDHDSIAKLRTQIQELLNKQNQQPSSGIDNTTLDAKRVRDLQEVNATLLALSKDAPFQLDLQRPFVKVALDCWAGDRVWRMCVVSALYTVTITFISVREPISSSC